jgi:mono/diheme cytochrome c family protein
MKRLLIAAALLAATSTVASAAEGKAVYVARCVSCHGTDGKGQTTIGKKLGVKDLTVSKLTAAEMEAVVTSGRGKMTPFGGKLQAPEIKEVAAFVKGGMK